MVHEPNLATGLLCTHHIITRALDVSIKYLSDGLIDENLKKGFIDYIQSFKTVLTTHHHLETQKIFPYFRDKIPDLPVDQLNREHGKIGVLLNEIDGIISDTDDELLSENSLEQINTALIGINEVWHPHIEVEEKYFTLEIMDRLLDKEETIRLLESYKPFIMERYKPDYLVLPFQFYNLSPKEREIWARQLPEVITKKMIPIDWKNEWTPMTEFLYPYLEDNNSAKSK